MVSSGRQTILSLLILLSLVAGAQSQSTVDKTLTSTISGKVTVGGKGLPGLIVGLALSDRFRSNFRATRLRSTTDEEGKYRITKVPPGTYEVIVASPIFVSPEGRKALIVGKNETLENVDITLLRGGVVTGKVTDADGQPVIEEMVNLTATTSEHRVPYFRNVRTDDRGIYRAYGVPAGKYKVSAGIDPGSSLGRQSQGQRQRTYHPSAVDPDAAFVIDVSEGNEATNVDIKFAGQAQTYTARGRIVDGDTNQPMPNARIGVQTFHQHYSSAMGRVAEATKNGEFKLENLPPGKYGVFSEPPAGSDWHSEAVDFEVTDRDVEGLLIKTSRGASVLGVVVLEGTDDPNLRANLIASRIAGRSVEGYIGRTDPSATINPNGSFRLTGVAPGRLTLNLDTRAPLGVIRVERDGMVHSGGLEVREREQVNNVRVVVGHANGTISGVITLSAELPPATRFNVLFRKTDNPTPGIDGTPVEVDTRGHFRIGGLLPGPYEIVVYVFNAGPTAQPPNTPPARRTVVVTNGTVTEVNITLQIPKPRPQ